MVLFIEILFLRRCALGTWPLAGPEHLAKMVAYKFWQFGSPLRQFWSCFSMRMSPSYSQSPFSYSLSDCADRIPACLML